MGLMTISEVSEVLRTPVATLRYWRHIGSGPRSFKVGSRIAYKSEDVDRWLAARAATSGVGDEVDATWSEDPGKVLKTIRVTAEAEGFYATMTAVDGTTLKTQTHEPGSYIEFDLASGDFFVSPSTRRRTRARR